MNKEYLQNFFKSICAGIMISLGARVYLACTNHVIGAILFSFGLIAIFLMDFKLYTGIVGYIRSPKDLPNLFITIIGNFIGSFYILFDKPSCAKELVEAKLALSIPSLFYKALICGAIIYICVETKKRNCIWFSLIGVPLFILSGAEHSIADMSYFIASGYFDIKMVLVIFIILIGNAIGSISLSLLQDQIIKEKNKC